MSSNINCPHEFEEDPGQWKRRWRRECQLCGCRNWFGKKMAECKICRRTFAHKRCLKAVATDCDGGPPVPSTSVPTPVAPTPVPPIPDTSTSVPQESEDAEVHDEPYAIEVTTTVEVDSITETVVIAPPSWLDTHEVDVPLTWAAEFTIQRGSDADAITSETVKTCVHFVTTVVVTEPRAEDGADGENISIRSEATWSTEIVPRQGCMATDEVDVDIRWSTNARVVDIIRVPAAAG